MLWTISWKNIWRNKTRSFVVILTIALGIMGGTFSIAFLFGMVEQKIKTAIENEVSHIQIHNPGFESNKDINLLINSSDTIVNYLSNNIRPKAITCRQITTGMVSSPNNAVGVLVIGIDPKTEKEVSGIHRLIIDGKYLNNQEQNIIMIGAKLAEKLKVKVNSRIVLTFQSVDSNLVSSALKVVGIYQSSKSSFDEANVFIMKNEFSDMAGISKTSVHEIAILLNKTNQTDSTDNRIKKMLPLFNVKKWAELQPDLEISTAFVQQLMWVVIIILLLAMGFGIVNTMLMVVLERTRELGVLMGVGMNKTKVFLMIMLETVYLSIFGGFVGLGMAYILIHITAIIGIDISKFGASGLAEFGFNSTVHPVLSIDIYFEITILVIITGILASIYPARKALKLNPVEAIRTL